MSFEPFYTISTIVFRDFSILVTNNCNVVDI